MPFGALRVAPKPSSDLASPRAPDSQGEQLNKLLWESGIAVDEPPSHLHLLFWDAHSMQHRTPAPSKDLLPKSTMRSCRGTGFMTCYILFGYSQYKLARGTALIYQDFMTSFENCMRLCQVVWTLHAFIST